MAAVAAIERDIFADPWSAKDFRECTTAGVTFLVASVDGAIAGYVVGRHAADEGEILNLGVARTSQRRGVGRALTQRALGELRAGGAHTAYLEVRESNIAARRLYEALGFQEVGRRRRYYRRPNEDGVILRVTLAQVAYL